MGKLKSAILYSAHPDPIRRIMKTLSIEELPKSRASKPEFIITYGGDGTFLTAEREWPGVPKIVLRHQHLNGDEKKLNQSVKKILEAAATEAQEVREYPKVFFTLGLTEGIASNDIILRNSNPNQALRFEFEKSNKGQFPQGEIIGDGLVLATSIGASAYYQSITRHGFKENFGLAFNNPTKPIDPVALEDDFYFKVLISRENGVMSLDNLPSFWVLRAGDVIEFRKHKHVTRVVELRQFYPETARKLLSF